MRLGIRQWWLSVWFHPKDSLYDGWCYRIEWKAEIERTWLFANLRRFQKGPGRCQQIERTAIRQNQVHANSWRARMQRSCVHSTQKPQIPHGEFARYVPRHLYGKPQRRRHRSTGLRGGGGLDLIHRSENTTVEMSVWGLQRWFCQQRACYAA